MTVEQPVLDANKVDAFAHYVVTNFPELADQLVQALSEALDLLSPPDQFQLAIDQDDYWRHGLA